MTVSNESILVSLIIPVIRESNEFNALIESLIRLMLDYKAIEVIVINQTHEIILSTDQADKINEIKTHCRLSASEARNAGAKAANGEYLWFLDDDAFFASSSTEFRHVLDLVRKRLSQVIVVQRGHIEKPLGYISHWPNTCSEITIFNFPTFTIEWNLLIQREAFFESGAWPPIGVGSDSAAQSGESFLLTTRLLGRDCRFSLCPHVLVAHPPLANGRQNLVKQLGYRYGAGYSLGMGLSEMGLKGKGYWTIRFGFAVLRDFVWRCSSGHLKGVREFYFCHVKLPMIRIIGFCDGLIGHHRGIKWLYKLCPDQDVV